MCGRYALAPTKKQVAEQLQALELPEDFQQLFNIAPTQRAWVLTKRLQKMQWGLVPSWSKDGINQGKMINARSEEIETKPSFREAIQSQRCLVPADSFYEWRLGPGKQKLPYRILLKNDQLMWMAGIWECWKNKDETLYTFSILTTAPNQEMETLHNRMPLILPDAEQQQRWLSDTNFRGIEDLIHPPADGILKYYRVSEKLNATGSNNPSLQDPVPDVLRLFD